MQKSWFYLGAIGSLAILMSGCGDSQPAATPAASPAATATPAATAPAATPAATATAPVAATTAPSTLTAKPATPDAKPGTPGVKPVSVDVAAGLIPPTNGESWAKTVAKGRTDPFATLALQPVEVVEKDPFGQPVKPQPATGKMATNAAPSIKDATPAIKSGVNSALPKIKIATVTGSKKIASNGKMTGESGVARYEDKSVSSIPRTGINRSFPKITVGSEQNSESSSDKSTKIASNNKAAGNNKTANNNVLRPVNIDSNSAPTPSPNDIATRSPQGAEQALQARAVEVSGVIEVEGKTQVIVKLPNESFSRYVNVGEKIANSNIVVKRIEDRGTISPTIVLSEGGTEVSHKIGDKPASQSPAK
jgi:hypothetical protein